MAERAHKRKPIQRVAWIVDATGRRCRCVMSDISEGGARLEFPIGTKLPAKFALSLTETGTVLRYCELRWNRGNAVGVRFLSAQAARQASR
jgi:hypothetical protein